MSGLVLQASDDLVARLAREGDPVRAIVELIWNSIDAEASAVTVRLDRDHFDGISAVHVEDDGHGISSDEVETTFGRIGNSWKKLNQKSKNGVRNLHGSLGQGRLRAFALGSRVVWKSRSINTVGVVQDVEVTGDHTNRAVFRWEATASAEPQEGTGTTVSAFNDAQRSLAALDSDDAILTLRAHFAPTLLNETNFAIVYDDSPLDPLQEVAHNSLLKAEFGECASGHTCQIRIIEWRAGKHRAIYFGPDEQHFIHEEPGSDVEGQYSYSAYVTWSGLTTESASTLGLGDMAPAPISDLWRAVRRTLREHFVTRRREHRREQIKQWKVSGVYPYQGEPSSESEQIERTVFDVVSNTLVPHISKRNNDARLTLALLKDAIRHDPDRLTTILHEVVSLSASDRETLTRLLGETTFPAIIKSANLVAGRRKFLAGLEHLLFDPHDSPDVGEREHLHRILERELWIFGEAYHLMSSERGLTELLKTHLRLEGLPLNDAKPVRRWDGRSGRVDLHLAAKFQEHDRVRHLVVELKAPGIRVGRNELNQVEDYGNSILAGPQFNGSTAQWDFILVATDMDDVARNRVQEDGFELGKFWGPPPRTGQPRVTAYVRRWRDIIDENKRRLEFFTSALEHDPSISEGLEYVQAQYADLLPSAVRRSDSEGR